METSAYIAVLIVTAVAAWWLSGFDARLLEERPAAALVRRSSRCGITLLLVAWVVPELVRWWRYSDAGSGISYLAASIPLALIWCGCIGELCARGFQRLIEPSDERKPVLAQLEHELDAIAGLVRQGRKHEAVQLCDKVKASGECSVLAIDALLERLGAGSSAGERGGSKKPSLLAEARQLRSQGRFGAAESKLRTLLAKDRENPPAAMLLMRIYAQDMKRRKPAEMVLRQLESQPYAPADLVEYARRSLDEWSKPGPRARQPGPGIESLLLPGLAGAPSRREMVNNKKPIDALLERGYLGTAVELLERQVKEQPGNFELALKLAEAHGHYCRNISRARKIVSDIECNPAFSQEEIALARGKLEEWRAGMGGG